MKWFTKVLLFVFVALIANLKAVNAITTSADIQKATTSFSFHKEIPETDFKIIENELINTCKSESDLLVYRSLVSSSNHTATKGGIQLTKKTFGHTFTTHGDDMTNFLLKRAEGSGMAQGQFLNNQKAAQFILDNVGKTANGAVNIPIPKNFPARVIMPDGTFKAATHIRLVPGGGGVKTAFPLIP
jgi:hypothetical protein